MSPDNTPVPVESLPARPVPRPVAPSTIQRLCEEMIALREHMSRQLKFFEQTLRQAKEENQSNFHQFVQETSRAYQQMRQELHGEKRHALALQNELLEITLDLARVAGSRPAADDPKPLQAWSESVAVMARKAEAILARLGILPYDAIIGTTYNPALHERVGNKRVEGMGPLLVAEQIERGYASQQPEFVLRRPKVLVSE
ncbi:MAG TPA: nucleotide exchange factor GrpE [Gemmataceae bacterium]|jgi:molecular chaperone GrpE (heat shock protein)|nr:nucleotide exchange factor GrpE [Gemmataceae bacterium]